jgi:hypothetical protein
MIVDWIIGSSRKSRRRGGGSFAGPSISVDWLRALVAVTGERESGQRDVRRVTATVSRETAA